MKCPLLPWLRPVACALASISAIAVTQSSSAEVLISEFLAQNQDGIADEDGDSSDWIEVFNSGPTQVNLGGYHLTDSSANLSKWTFPPITLGAGEFLVVFASGKDRRDPDRELHTNFSLNRSGEYLGLIAPDGSTVADEYAPFPQQFADLSYGKGQEQRTEVLIPEGAAARYLIPVDGSVDGVWRDLGFDDSTWGLANMGIGYDENTTYDPHFGAAGNGAVSGDLDTALNDVRTSVYLRIPFTVAPGSNVLRLTLRMKYDDGFAAFINGFNVAEANNPGNLSYVSAASALHEDAASRQFRRLRSLWLRRVLGEGANCSPSMVSTTISAARIF
ncbi:MAG: lamin tail domain-containing protein [Verrucomicrobiales bacterium]